MRDSQYYEQVPRDGHGVSALARSVVARLLARDARAERALDPDLLAQMVRTLLSFDPKPFTELSRELRRARLTDVELVDQYFPAAARELGCDWAADRASWAAVSIGIARMQAAVHEIGRGWSENSVATSAAPTAVLLIPEGEQHSFGPMVLLHQLRRRGVSVRLQIGAKPDDLPALLAERRFDCALISIGCEARLALAQSLTATVRKLTGNTLPVAIGGAVLDRPVDVKGRTGADIVTNDLDEMLAAIGTSAARVS